MIFLLWKFLVFLFADIADFQYRYGTRLRYAAITVNLTVKPTTLAFPDGLPVRDEWEDFMTKEVSHQM